jgi:hypothetical protein
MIKEDIPNPSTVNHPSVNNNHRSSYSIEWKYGEKARYDSIEVINKTSAVVLRRWSTFISLHFPQGAIVTGFRGRRDYKDGKCQGIMCCRWCPEKKIFMPFIFTISNGYNDTFSEKDFETIELISEDKFTFYNSRAIKNIKSELK